MASLAPLIAVIGCDGSGKSTLAEALVADYSARRPVAYVYLGLKWGAMGEAIKQWPIIGGWLEKKLSKRASQARDTKQKIPGVATALVIYLLAPVRLRRFRQTPAHRRAGPGRHGHRAQGVESCSSESPKRSRSASIASG